MTDRDDAEDVEIEIDDESRRREADQQAEREGDGADGAAENGVTADGAAENGTTDRRRESGIAGGDAADRVEESIDPRDLDPVGVGYGRAGDETLGDELGSVDLRTTDEGFVEGRVTGLESVDDSTVRLSVALPHGPTVDFDLEKPIPWSETFLLARIVEDVGYDASSVDHLVGETVYVARTDAGPTAEGNRDDRQWSRPVRNAGNAMFAALGADLRLEADRDPEWRLVDPLERPSTQPTRRGAGRREVLPVIASAAVLVGAAGAAVGAVLAATGSVPLSVTVFVGALPGLVLVAVGLLALRSLTD